MKIEVHTDDLLKFAGKLNKAGGLSKHGVAKALNQVGDGLRREIVVKLSAETGLPQDEIMRVTVAQRATADRHIYDIMVPDIERAKGSRALPSRKFGNKGRTVEEFEPGSLVNVLTAKDHKVCHICEEIEADNPYTIEEATKNIHHGATIGLNGCRCQLVPFVPMQRMNVHQEAQPGSSRTSPMSEASIHETAQKSLRELANQVVKETVDNFRITLK